VRKGGKERSPFCVFCKGDQQEAPGKLKEGGVLERKKKSRFPFPRGEGIRWLLGGKKWEEAGKGNDAGGERGGVPGDSCGSREGLKRQGPGHERWGEDPVLVLSMRNGGD